MLADLLRGAKYAVSGIRFYRKHREYRRDAILPLLILLLIYTVFAVLGAYGAVACSNFLSDRLAVWPNWLQWLAVILHWCIFLIWPILFLLMVGATVSIGYEMLGGIMFDSLVAHFEEREYRIPPHRHTGGYCVRFIADSCLYACNTAILTVLLFLPALFIPVLGPIAQFAILGYRYAISSLGNVAYNRGLRIRDLKRSASEHISVVFGYGITCYAFMLVPFLSILVYPGLMIGGAMLYEAELEKSGKSLPVRSRTAQ